MSTQILNLTPHEINIGTASIKPFGVVARVYVESISDGEFTTASGTTIPISHSYYGDVENLPNPMPNTIYIVSALDAAIRQLKTQDDWFLTTKTGLAKRIVTLYDEIIAAADFPVSLPVRDVLNYSSAAFMNYVKLGCNYITRKFNVRHSPTTVYSYGYNYSNEALHEKASYPYTIDDFFADPLRKSLFVIGCYNYLHDVIDGKIKPTKMTEAKAETKPLTLQSATTLAAPPIAPTIPITKTNTVSCSATKTCAAYKPVPQSPAKP